MPYTEKILNLHFPACSLINLHTLKQYGPRSNWSHTGYEYSKTCLKRPLKKKTKIGFEDQLLLNAGQKYCKGSILQYFQPSLCYHLSLRSLFCLFLSGRLRQVLL